MKNIFESLFEQGNIWGVIVVGAAFFAISLIGQTAHEDGKKWGRPFQYTVGGVFLIFFIWLMTYL